MTHPTPHAWSKLDVAIVAGTYPLESWRGRPVTLDRRSWGVDRSWLCSRLGHAGAKVHVTEADLIPAGRDDLFVAVPMPVGSNPVEYGPGWGIEVTP